MGGHIGKSLFGFALVVGRSLKAALLEHLSKQSVVVFLGVPLPEESDYLLVKENAAFFFQTNDMVERTKRAISSYISQDFMVYRTSLSL